MTSDQAFIDLSKHYLVEDYPSRIKDCVLRLSHEQVWWKANQKSNSIAHIILHLIGNCGQWVHQGLGDIEFIRERDKEFNSDSTYSPRELLDLLSKCKSQSELCLNNLAAESLDNRMVIQGFSVSRREALFHAAEHFSMHTGQIIYITKMLKDEALDFYSITKSGARPRWKDSGV